MEINLIFLRTWSQPISGICQTPEQDDNCSRSDPHPRYIDEIIGFHAPLLTAPPPVEYIKHIILRCESWDLGPERL